MAIITGCLPTRRAGTQQAQGETGWCGCQAVSAEWRPSRVLVQTLVVILWGAECTCTISCVGATRRYYLSYLAVLVTTIRTASDSGKYSIQIALLAITSGAHQLPIPGRAALESGNSSRAQVADNGRVPCTDELESARADLAHGESTVQHLVEVVACAVRYL